jgi:hypothetical protein
MAAGGRVDLESCFSLCRSSSLACGLRTVNGDFGLASRWQREGPTCLVGERCVFLFERVVQVWGSS